MRQFAASERAANSLTRATCKRCPTRPTSKRGAQALHPRWHKEANDPDILDADVHAAILGVVHGQVMRHDCGPDARRHHELRQSTARWHQPSGLFNGRAIISRAAFLRVPGVRSNWRRPQNDCSNEPEDRGNCGVHGRSRKWGAETQRIAAGVTPDLRVTFDYS
jgi:hypothetical protein